MAVHCETAVFNSSSVAFTCIPLSSSEQSSHASVFDAFGKAQDVYGQHTSITSRLASLDTGMVVCLSGTAASPLHTHRTSAGSIPWAGECDQSDCAEEAKAPHRQPLDTLLQPVSMHAFMGSTDSSCVSSSFSNIHMGQAVVGTDMLCSVDARPHIDQPHSTAVQAMEPSHSEPLASKLPSEEEGEAEEDSDWLDSEELTQDGAAETAIRDVSFSPFQAANSVSVAVGSRHSSCNGTPAGIDGPSGTSLIAFNSSLQVARAGSPDTVGSVCQVGDKVPCSPISCSCT